MIITWDLTGRGSEKTATVYCGKCCEILESGIPVGEARYAAAGFEMVHKCRESKTKAP